MVIKIIHYHEITYKKRLNKRKHRSWKNHIVHHHLLKIRVRSILYIILINRISVHS